MSHAVDIQLRTLTPNNLRAIDEQAALLSVEELISHGVDEALDEDDLLDIVSNALPPMPKGLQAVVDKNAENGRRFVEHHCRRKFNPLVDELVKKSTVELEAYILDTQSRHLAKVRTQNEAMLQRLRKSAKPEILNKVCSHALYPANLKY